MDDITFESMVSQFKIAWHTADLSGQVGHRTEVGIGAVLAQIDEALQFLIDTESVRIRYDDDEAAEFIAVRHLEAFRDRIAPGGDA